LIWLEDTAVAVNPAGTGDAVVSRIMVSEYGDVLAFPAPSLYHTYTVFVPSPVSNVHAFVVAYASHKVQELVLLMHIWETPLVASEADKAKVTDVNFVYAALLLIMIELLGGVVSRMMLSEYGVVFGFPAPSLYHTYTVFVPSPVSNVHAFVVAYASHAVQELVLLMHIWETPLVASEADKVKVAKVKFV
jgi:hypothetical protein